MALFSRSGSMFLAISQANPSFYALLFKWSGSGFINFQEVPVSGTTQVEALSSGDDTYLIFTKNIHLGEKIVFLMHT
jgi:G-protein coupled receptor 98